MINSNYELDFYVYFFSSRIDHFQFKYYLFYLTECKALIKSLLNMNVQTRFDIVQAWNHVWNYQTSVRPPQPNTQPFILTLQPRILATYTTTRFSTIYPTILYQMHAIISNPWTYPVSIECKVSSIWILVC